MKTNILVVTLATLFLASNVMAEKPKDVKVVNDSTESVPVTVQNPVAPPTSITVDNDGSSPVPVTIQNAPTSITVDNDGTSPVPVTIENAVTIQNPVTPPTSITVDNDDTSPVPVSIVNGGTNGGAVATEVRLVGFTATTTTGRVSGIIAADGLTYQGIMAMHKLCNDEVTLGSRACSTSEINRSATAFDDFQKEGWLLVGDIAYVKDGTQWYAIDEISGYYRAGASNASPGFARALMDCDSYRDEEPVNVNNYTAPIGPSFSGDRFGMVGTGFCNVSRPVACCAPVEIPTQQPQ